MVEVAIILRALSGQCWCVPSSHLICHICRQTNEKEAKDWLSLWSFILYAPTWSWQIAAGNLIFINTTQDPNLYLLYRIPNTGIIMHSSISHVSKAQCPQKLTQTQGCANTWVGWDTSHMQTETLLICNPAICLISLPPFAFFPSMVTHFIENVD